MTDDETTVLEVIMYLQARGALTYSEDIKRNCILSVEEIYASLSSLTAERAIRISPQGWVTTA